MIKKNSLTLKFVLRLVVFLFAALFLLNSCQTVKDSHTVDETEPKKTIYTSIHSVFDFTKKLAADDFLVLRLMPPGTEVHDWEPGPKDIAELSEADLFIYSGAGMEPWLEQVKASAPETLQFVDTSSGITLIEAKSEHESNNGESLQEGKTEAQEDGGHEHAFYDPHISMNPQNVILQMNNIAAALKNLEPGKAAAIDQRLTVECESLRALDNDFSE